MQPIPNLLFHTAKRSGIGTVVNCLVHVDCSLLFLVSVDDSQQAVVDICKLLVCVGVDLSNAISESFAASLSIMPAS